MVMKKRTNCVSAIRDLVSGSITFNDTAAMNTKPQAITMQVPVALVLIQALKQAIAIINMFVTLLKNHCILTCRFK